MIRTFFYLEEQPFEHLLATLSFHDINNPGILTCGNEYQYAADKYFDGSLSNHNDMISVIIPDVSPDTWCSADFPVVFDKNIQNSIFDSKKWVFKFYGCENYAISLKGTVGPASNNQQTISGSKSDVSSGKFSATHAKIHKQLESNDKFMQQMQSSVSKIDTTSPEYLQAYKGVVESLKTISQLFTAAKGLSAGASAVMGFLKVVNGNFNDQNSTSPAAVTQYLELEGSMDIEFNLGGNTLKIPGVNGSYFPPVSWNPYDCPVGYFNLEETPKIKKTTSYEKYKFHDTDGGSMGMKDGKIAFIYNLLDFPTLNALGNHPPVNGYLGKFVKYQFNDDNVLSFHQIPGLELVDVHFALVCKLTGTGGEKFDITDEYIPCKFWDLYGKEYHVPVVNPICEGLDMGQYKLYKFDVDNDGVYFGTPELPMNKLKDVVIEVPEKSEIMLRVIAKFSSDKYNDPIMFQANYKMDVLEENAQKDRLFFSMEQQNFHWDYFTHDLMVKINMSTSSQYEAHEIVMEPGFVGTNGYVATSVNMSYPTKGNTVFHSYSFTCSNNLKSATANNVDSNVDSEFNKNRDIKVYPNPSNGFVYISSTELDDEIIKIELYNNIGALVYVNEDIETSEFELNLSDYNSGLYFMKVLMNNNINYSKKIILE